MLLENALDDESFAGLAMWPNRRGEEEHDTKNGDDHEEEHEIDDRWACFTAMVVRRQSLKQGIFEQHRKSLSIQPRIIKGT